ncbi:MAG: recombinase family protein [Nanoarchaeota archaeon]|nr:recombinase family protein [Nanoarchaeota archaeon]
MVCKKCGYLDPKETEIFKTPLCEICSRFAPSKISSFQEYIAEKIDWKILDTFRKYGFTKGHKQKLGMAKKASIGIPVTRSPLGYEIRNKKLIQNEDASKVHSLFKTYLNRNYSLNSLAKNFALSINGLKKVLTNRTYLGEIKFDGKIHNGDHKAIISDEIFYAVGRKLRDQLRPRRH